MYNFDHFDHHMRSQRSDPRELTLFTFVILMNFGYAIMLSVMFPICFWSLPSDLCHSTSLLFVSIVATCSSFSSPTLIFLQHSHSTHKFSDVLHSWLKVICLICYLYPSICLHFLCVALFLYKFVRSHLMCESFCVISSQSFMCPVSLICVWNQICYRITVLSKTQTGFVWMKFIR